MRSFSLREGYAGPKKIEFRDTLPAQLRVPILAILKDHVRAEFLMERVTAILDPYGINPLPKYVSVPMEDDDPDPFGLKRVLLDCQWFQVYDILEDIFKQLCFHETELADAEEEPRAYPMQKRINEYFAYAGIGWQMVDGQIIARLDEPVENGINAATSELKESGRPTAAQHIIFAVRALSERPKANTAGAVSHATSSVECVLGEITGKPSLSLGKQLEQLPVPLHAALKKALDGMYGFASDAGARHGKEGVEPGFQEAQFAVTTCAATCTLLSALYPKEKQS